MFYISQISGEQIPYTPESFSELRSTSAVRTVDSIDTENTFSVAQLETAQGIINNSIEENSAVVLEGNLRNPSSPPSADLTSGLSSAAFGLAAGGQVRTPMRPGQPTEDSNDAPKPAHQIEQIVRSQKSRTLKKEDYHQEVMVEAPSSSSQALSAYLEVTEKNPQREKVLRAEQIMSSNVVTLSSSDRLKEARHIFENRRFRHVPIVSNTGKLVGILSDRDLLKNLNQQGIEKPLSIEDVMVKSVLTARPETEIRMIAKIMFDERIGALPIVDSDEKLVGILTRSDILRTIVNRAPLELWT